MSPRHKKYTDDIDEPEVEPVTLPPVAKEEPDWCGYCNAQVRPTRDGRHKCQCRTEKV